MNIVENKSIIDLVKKRQLFKVRDYLANQEIPEVADFIADLDNVDKVLVFRVLPRNMSTEVFSYMEPDDQDNLIENLTNAETKQILLNLTPDDRTAFLEELPAEIIKKLISLLPPEELKEARELLGYPEESVGRLMTPDYISVEPTWKISEALDKIRKEGKDSETINVIYVTDKKGILIDDVRLRLFLLANPNDSVESLLDGHVVSLSAHDDREKAVKQMKRYDLVALPVVNSENILLGIVTVDDVMDVAEEEATEDIHKSVSINPLKTSYDRAGILMLFYKRIVWLFVLVIVSLISANVLAVFEKTLSSAIALAFFIPLLLGTGGNTGSQSAVLVIRALVTEELKLNEWVFILLKELIIGILLGLALGILGGGIALFISHHVKIGLIVGTAMFADVFIANILGMFLPIILAKIKLDPAVASSPLISTIMDTTGLLIYFGIATFVLSF